MLRRDFFKRVLGAVVAAAGATQIAPGAVTGYRMYGFTAGKATFLGEIDAITAQCVMPGLVDNFFKEDPMLAYLKARSGVR